MKHLKAANRKARAVEAVRTGGDVKSGWFSRWAVPTIFNPGWEADPWGGAHAMCSPTEADLAGCSGICWWPAQVPEQLAELSGMGEEVCSGVNMEDWRSLNVEFPKVKVSAVPVGFPVRRFLDDADPLAASTRRSVLEALLRSRSRNQDLDHREDRRYSVEGIGTTPDLHKTFFVWNDLWKVDYKTRKRDGQVSLPNSQAVR